MSPASVGRNEARAEIEGREFRLEVHVEPLAPRGFRVQRGTSDDLGPDPPARP